MRLRSAGSRSSVQRASRSAHTSPGGTRRPVSPSITASGSPPVAEATTGRPQAMASNVTSACGSGQIEGTTPTAQCAQAAITWACGTLRITITPLGNCVGVQQDMEPLVRAQRAYEENVAVHWRQERGPAGRGCFVEHMIGDKRGYHL